MVGETFAYKVWMRLALGEQGEGLSLSLLVDFLLAGVETVIFCLLLVWESADLLLFILIIKLIYLVSFQSFLIVLFI